MAINIKDDSAYNVLIDGVAFDDGTKHGLGDNLSSTSARQSRKALHVQSRSFWAAANIGPYSQSVNTESRITIAGQIGLLPSTLQLAQDVPLQIALSLQHARRVFKATLESRAEKQKGWIEGCICWLDDLQWLAAAQRSWQLQYNNDEDGWESTWLGESLRSDSVPATFIILPKGGLPRAAAVEWQLFAHDGKAVSKAHDGSDQAGDGYESQDGEAPDPEVSSKEVIHYAGCVGSYRAITSKEGDSTFGIIYLKSSTEAKREDSAEISALLSSALHLKILYQRQNDLDSSE